MMRSMVLAAHGHYGNQKTIDGAQSRFGDHVSGKAICNVNLRTTVSYLDRKFGRVIHACSRAVLIVCLYSRDS